MGRENIFSRLPNAGWRRTAIRARVWMASASTCQAIFRIPSGSEWHKLVKSTKPDAYISGEIWDWAQAWLNDGDQFDAVMNYRFAVAAQEFFVDQKKAITPTQFNTRLNQLVYTYPLQVALVR